MNKRFYVKPELCTGCRSCELACSFTHAIDNIRTITRINPLDGGIKDLWVPVTCLQCDDAACIKSCLVDALKRNLVTGAVELNHEVCVNCMACVASCPFGCAILDTQTSLIVKCDLCGGDPACAHFCPTNALVWKEIPKKIKKTG